MDLEPRTPELKLFALTSIDVDAMGHVRLDVSEGGMHREGDFLLLSNGSLVYGRRTFSDMQSIRIEDAPVYARREAGYGRLLGIVGSAGPTILRYINCAWHRLTVGGPLLGHSVPYRVALEPEWLRLPSSKVALQLQDTKFAAGPVTLSADGTVSVFDLEFLPGSEIDVCSPQAELSRKEGNSYLALRVPKPGATYLQEYPRAQAPKTTWYDYARGKWHQIQVHYGPRPKDSLLRRSFRALLPIAVASLLRVPVTDFPSTQGVFYDKIPLRFASLFRKLSATQFRVNCLRALCGEFV